MCVCVLGGGGGGGEKGGWGYAVRYFIIFVLFLVMCFPFFCLVYLDILTISFLRSFRRVCFPSLVFSMSSYRFGLVYGV